jgi:hypothetical protein
MLGAGRRAIMLFGLPTRRCQLTLEQLPRGFVPLPERLVEAVEYLQQKTAKRSSAE